MPQYSREIVMFVPRPSCLSQCSFEFREDAAECVVEGVDGLRLTPHHGTQQGEGWGGVLEMPGVCGNMKCIHERKKIKYFKDNGKRKKERKKLS